MSPLELLRRLNTFFHRKQFETELGEEIRLHREMKERELLETGVARKEASYAKRLVEKRGVARQLHTFIEQCQIPL